MPFFTGEPRGATEGQPVLVPVELPDDFVIPQPWVEIRDTRPEPQWRASSVHGITVPIDRGRAAAKREPLVSEQIVASVSQPVGLPDGVPNG
jgi:hypothetical protein